MTLNVRRRVPRIGSILGVGTALALTLMAGAARSQSPITLELNRLEAREGACRAVFLIRNPGPALDELRFDFALFDRAGVITRRIAVDLGPIPAEKTQVKSFDVGGIACEGIGSVLLNDITACRIGGAVRNDCLSQLSLSSRAGIEFIR
jgi:hypothetical protein